MELNVILATDCGSTTTKAILIEKKDGVYRQTFRGKAPTTVEAPFEDITRGVLNAFVELEDLSGRMILDGEKIITPAEGNRGVDVYVSTSSAGGGLQMMVAGAVKSMTAESAQRAALGAGAIVMDVLAGNDGRLPHQKIECIRALRPDMILLSGGTDGGTVTHVVELAEYIAAADPRPRLGLGYRLPVVFAGNKDARDPVRERLGERTELSIVDNLRPTLEEENLQPARHRIQDLFMEHVMAQAPGYDKLKTWVGAPIMPTPGAVGKIMQTIARLHDINVIGVDIGGATTDVFSIFKEDVGGKTQQTYNRTVSANLGMSYSVGNVLAEAGIENVLRWLRFELPEGELRNRVKNKMIRPTTVPQTLEDLQLEQALSREALRLSLDQHKLLATSLKGVQRKRTISDAFRDAAADLVNMWQLDLLVGSGGVLSHAPRRAQAMLMMLDAFGPLGFTRIAVDSIFMMPHLGVLSELNEKAAAEVFERDCLVHLGTAVGLGGDAKPGAEAARYSLTFADGQRTEGVLLAGQLVRIPLGEVDSEGRLSDVGTARISLAPSKSFDAGAGKGKAVERAVTGGVVGLVLDARGRPLDLPADHAQRRARLSTWFDALKSYPAQS